MKYLKSISCGTVLVLGSLCLGQAGACTLGYEHSDSSFKFGVEDLNLLSPIEEKYMRANCFFEEGKYTEATALLNELRIAMPQNKEILKTLGLAQYHLGEYQEAINNLRDSVEAERPDLEIMLYVARSYIHLGMNNRAENVLKLGAELVPNVAREAEGTIISVDGEKIYIEISDFYLKENQQSLARKYLVEGYKKNPGSEELFKRLLMVLELGKDESATNKLLVTECKKVWLKSLDECRNRGVKLN